jgi:SAM-dependent methyltransferase
MPQAIGDGKFYDDLQQYKGYYPGDKPEFTEAARYITSEDDVLEVGAGEGLFTHYIRCRSYTGLEFSDQAIDKADKKGIKLLHQSLEDHAGENPERYHAVCYFQVLEHVPHPGRFISDSLRCLKPGGKLILAVPSEDSFIKDAPNFYLNMPPHHASRWTDNALRKIGELYGLDLLQLFHEPLHPFHEMFYYKTMAYKKLNGATSPSSQSVDIGLSATIRYGIATATAMLKKRLLPMKSRPVGQSVTAIFQKR